MTFQEALVKARVDESAVRDIMNVDYPKASENLKQDNANFMAAAMRKCEELLGFEKTGEVMFHRACCKGGFRLENAKRLAKEHDKEPLQVKLKLLGELQYMEKPTLNVDGDIETVAIGARGIQGMKCPCWNFGGCTPANGPMPLSYCLCCAGHFRFHYEKALSLKLKAKKVASSIINSSGSEPCVFVYQIVK